jgi:hypothetical protein
VLVAVGARGQEAPDVAVKASFLYKLASFVDWPANSFASNFDPFVICVVGKDPFGPVLDRAVAGQRAGSRMIVVKRLARAPRDSGCQIMYLGGSTAQPVKDALDAVHATPVLTVTDEASAAGVIDFALDKGTVRLRVDNQLAAEDGLSISSKLLGLAMSVKPRIAAPPKP